MENALYKNKIIHIRGRTIQKSVNVNKYLLKHLFLGMAFILRKIFFTFALLFLNPKNDLTNWKAPFFE
jgi:hypothetical protein